MSNTKTGAAIPAYKKCLACGKRYPVHTKQQVCDCKGFLYTVSGCYMPKIKH